MKLLISSLFIGVTLTACAVIETDTSSNSNSTSETSLLTPASDPANKQGWVLNHSVSDEFNASEIDRNKWYVQGTNQEFYIWKGRAPSQFAPHNVMLEDGKLKLRTQWEPDYDFVGTPPKKQEIQKYENITTAAVISHNTFLYGYMEVKVKIPDAAMTGAFWGTGYQQELDVFELIGRVKVGSRRPESTFVTSIHDWRPGHAKKNKVWKHPHKMDGRTADAFHIYGVEWLPDGLKMYLDGELIHHATQAEMGDTWLLNNPLELWFDSEIFPWHGIPVKEELPVDFEIDYVRVWQQPNENVLAPEFFGFEGPFSSRLVKKPESRNVAYKNWWMDDVSKNYFKITNDLEFIFSTGRNSLEFSSSGKLNQDEVTAFSPYGSIALEGGSYNLEFKLMLDEGAKINALNLVLESPWLELPPIDLTNVKTGQWLDIIVPFERLKKSHANDRLRIIVKNKDVTDKPVRLFIDDIQIKPVH